MADKLPPPKGRAGLLMKLLAQAKEQKPGGEQSREDSPKPRGRAALLQKIAQLQAAKRLGSEGPSSTTKVAKVTEELEETTEPRSYKGKMLPM